jgi:uncharacterized protein (TIGR00369 family)
MGFTPRDPEFERRVRDSFGRQALMGHLGAEIARLEPGLCEITLPFRPELSQQHGFFHAGITSTIADSAGGYAAYSLMPADSSVLTVEYKINLLAPADGERLFARGQVVRPGRSLTVCELRAFVVKGGTETLCAVGTQTVFCLAGKSDHPPE